VKPYFEKPFTKRELAEWLKVKALHTSPSTAKTKQNKTKNKTATCWNVDWDCVGFIVQLGKIGVF
jgi:hypothetical protein